jgi:acyl transferase domain-containing protein
LIAAAGEQFGQLLARTDFQVPRLPVYSNTTGGVYPTDRAASALLARHLVHPVRFADQVLQMYADGARLFVEVGPRSVLSHLVDQILEDRPHLAVGTDTPALHGLTQLQHTLGQLAAHGVPINLDRFFAGGRAQTIELTTLVQQTRDGAPGATTWLVNGGSVRPAHAVATPLKHPVVVPPIPRPKLNGQHPVTHADLANGAAHPEPPTPPQAQHVSTPAATSDSATHIMLEHQRLMEQFLETHQRVMLAYLGGAAAPASPPTPAPNLVPLSMNSAVPERDMLPDRTPLLPEPEAQPVEINPPVASIAVPDRERILHDLEAIVSERTGYPLEVLRADVDLEGELGVDSIKRVEIIGALRRKYLPQDAPIGPSIIEALAGAKTLGTIVDALMRALGPDALDGTTSSEQAEVPRFVVGAVHAGALARRDQ